MNRFIRRRKAILCADLMLCSFSIVYNTQVAFIPIPIDCVCMCTSIYIPAGGGVSFIAALGIVLAILFMLILTIPFCCTRGKHWLVDNDPEACSGVNRCLACMCCRCRHYTDSTELENGHETSMGISQVWTLLCVSSA